MERVEDPSLVVASIGGLCFSARPRRRRWYRDRARRYDARHPDRFGQPDELWRFVGQLDRLRLGEPVEFRHFAGLTGEQAAEVLGISAATADRHWAYARAWLQAEVRGH